MLAHARGAPGVNGGGRGAPQRQLKVGRTRTAEVIGGLDEDGTWRSCLLANHPFKGGGRSSSKSGGGGGWGDPLEPRPARQCSRTCSTSMYPLESARGQYGVVIVDGAIDEAATANLRSELQGSGRKSRQSSAIRRR